LASDDEIDEAADLVVVFERLLDDENVGERGSRSERGERGDVASRSTAATRFASESGGNLSSGAGFFCFSGDLPATASRRNDARPGEVLFSRRA